MLAQLSDRAEDSSPLQQRLHGDKLALLFRQSMLAALVALAVASILAAIYWSHGTGDRAIVWIAMLLVSVSLRAVLFLRFARARPQGADILRWERPYLATMTLPVLIWSLGSIWAMPPDSLLDQAITYAFLMGMCGGALSMYSAMRPVALATIAALLLPFTVQLLIEGGAVRLWLAAGGVLFFLSALRATRVLSTALEQSFQLTYALQASREDALALASQDELTGLINRRAFFERATAALALCEREGTPACVMLIDADHFKSINDNHGHAVGDQALIHLAQLLRAGLRKSDLCCRLGGEEFAVLLPATALEPALAVAEKLRVAIAGAPLVLAPARIAMTASLGVANGSHDLQTLLRHADDALYAAKHSGRNRVCAAANAVR